MTLGPPCTTGVVDVFGERRTVMLQDGQVGGKGSPAWERAEELDSDAEADQRGHAAVGQGRGSQ